MLGLILENNINAIRKISRGESSEKVKDWIVNIVSIDIDTIQFGVLFAKRFTQIAQWE